MKFQVSHRVKVTSGIFKGEEGSVRVIDKYGYYIDFDKAGLDLSEIRFYDGELTSE